MLGVEKLDLRVSGVDFSYSSTEEGIEGVRLRFFVTDPTGEINASGRVQVTMEEYFQAPGLVALVDLIREKFIYRLEAPTEEAE